MEEGEEYYFNLIESKSANFTFAEQNYRANRQKFDRKQAEGRGIGNRRERKKERKWVNCDHLDQIHRIEFGFVSVEQSLVEAWVVLSSSFDYSISFDFLRTCRTCKAYWTSDNNFSRLPYIAYSVRQIRKSTGIFPGIQDTSTVPRGSALASSIIQRKQQVNICNAFYETMGIIVTKM